MKPMTHILWPWELREYVRGVTPMTFPDDGSHRAASPSHPEGAAGAPDDASADPNVGPADPTDDAGAPEDASADPNAGTADPNGDAGAPGDGPADPNDDAGAPEDAAADPNAAPADPNDAPADPVAESALDSDAAAPATSEFFRTPYVAATPDDFRWCAPIKQVTTYHELVEQVARLVSFNTRYQFYYRGQKQLARLKNGLGNTVVASIWRDVAGDGDFEARKRALKENSQLLREEYSRWPYASRHIVNRMNESPLVQWALLEHYECCRTPLLNLTRSLHVASTFALRTVKGEGKPEAAGGTDETSEKGLPGTSDGTGETGAKGAHGAAEDKDETGYLVVIGLPHQREAITTNHRQGILNIELLGVTPHNAKRPLLQDGFLACSFDWWRTFCGDPYAFGPRDVVDFSGRVAAILELRNEWDDDRAAAKRTRGEGYKGEFWESGMGGPIEDPWLFPEDDDFLRFLKGLEFERV